MQSTGNSPPTDSLMLKNNQPPGFLLGTDPSIYFCSPSRLETEKQYQHWENVQKRHTVHVSGMSSIFLSYM